MAESRRDQHAQKEMERPSGGNRQDARPGNGQRGSEAARQQAERFAEAGREGMREANEVSTAAASGAARSGLALAEGAQEITTAWARYAEEVMRHTSEASQALLRAQSFNEMLEVQARLLRDNMQAFLDQSARIGEVASRMARRPFVALKEANAEQTRR
jgi:hypothetical protein